MAGLEDEIHAGSFHSLMRMLEAKQTPFAHAADILPPANVDLAALRGRIVIAPTEPPHDQWRDDATRKFHNLRHELAGQSELALLHAMVIAILRRRDPPDAARALFLRIWREEGRALARALPVRWLISAATTFADHGETGAQRAGGMGLSVLFDMIKLHDSERRLSGQPGDAPFARVPAQDQQPLAFDMQGYALNRGDLDRVMLARLWQLCEDDATFAPLGMRMLRMVMADRRSIFARVQALKPGGVA